ncbi:hypothetical protein [Streptomyces sp. TBY4]|uniref:hypothetical protein n=1 Tax=Streptomyces sp. TBY4 TaxID=2962030 RepID=UPI0020B6AC34|nr:hypothetical protein [Streptomyces sp. TBY4]MCP3759658.1 hypothetical protein [Streptomyces sp. TBY4]
MSFKHLPLLGTAEIIATLNLSNAQTQSAASLAHTVARRAWSRRPGHKHGQDYEEFAAAIPACSWLTMFEVGALLQLGRRCEAENLMAAARLVHPSRARSGARR